MYCGNDCLSTDISKACILWYSVKNIDENISNNTLFRFSYHYVHQVMGHPVLKWSLFLLEAEYNVVKSVNIDIVQFLLLRIRRLKTFTMNHFHDGICLFSTNDHETYSFHSLILKEFPFQYTAIGGWKSGSLVCASNLYLLSSITRVIFRCVTWSERDIIAISIRWHL